MPANYINLRARSHIELNELNEAQKGPASERMVFLLENPKARNKQIMARVVGRVMELYARETGNEGSAVELAEDLGEGMKASFAELSEVPQTERGIHYSTVRSAVYTVCQNQSFIEYLGIAALEIGDRMGRQNKAAASRMSTPQKKQMAKDGQLKKTLNQLEAAKKSDKLKE